MAGGLPSMVHGDGIAKRTQVRFGGYNHTLYAGDGEIYDMQNMTSDHYPVLAAREIRQGVTGRCSGFRGIYMRGGRVFASRGEDFYELDLEGEQKNDISPSIEYIHGFLPKDGEKRFVSLGDYIIIMPDKKYYNTKDGTHGSLEAKMLDLDVKIQNGTYKGEEAKANTLYSQGAKWSDVFKAGDAVELEGFSDAANNKTIIIREIEGDFLRFYENSFVMPEDGWGEGGVSVARTVPDMDFMCENENRLWGCKGSRIYASKPGDPFNWNVFEGLSTDSFAADVGSTGDFTGCIKYLGYPCFFKEDHIYKVYGDRPANFQVMGSASLGVSKGSGKSLAIAGETLFYLSRVGIVAYSGGIPQSIAEAFGNVKYKNAVAGSDGIKYYVSMEDEAGAHHFFVYDTRKNMWHKEDDTKVIDFTGEGETLLCMPEDGGAFCIGKMREGWRGFDRENTCASFVEFGDFTDGDPNRKGTGKLQLRLELDEGASVTVKIQFDSDGVWRDVKTLSAEKKKSFYLPVVPRRADHYRVKIEGIGMWRLYSMVRESYSGSEL